MFLLDSLVSVFYYEFFWVWEFVGQLVVLLFLGIGVLCVSLVYVGSWLYIEFFFGQYSLGEVVQDVVCVFVQCMGDIYIGLVLVYVKEQLFVEVLGVWLGVFKVLVWVIDGGFSDFVGFFMQEFKDLGVIVFIVSIG